MVVCLELFPNQFRNLFLHSINYIIHWNLLFMFYRKRSARKRLIVQRVRLTLLVHLFLSRLPKSPIRWPWFGHLLTLPESPLKGIEYCWTASRLVRWYVNYNNSITPISFVNHVQKYTISYTASCYVSCHIVLMYLFTQSIKHIS